MYAYCNNNPVMFVDASGYRIVLATDATNEQKKEYERAIAYLKTSETGRKLIELLEESTTVLTIAFTDDNSMCYSSGSNTIYFDINCGLAINDASSTQSPAIGLAHEMGHAAQELTGIRKGSVNEIEEHNLTTYEIPIATELGEPVRYNYYGVFFPMEMQNSIHFTTPSTKVRPWWHYIFIWNWGKPRVEPIDHNLDS